MAASVRPSALPRPGLSRESAAGANARPRAVTPVPSARSSSVSNFSPGPRPNSPSGLAQSRGRSPFPGRGGATALLAAPGRPPGPSPLGFHATPAPTLASRSRPWPLAAAQQGTARPRPPGAFVLLSLSLLCSWETAAEQSGGKAHVHKLGGRGWSPRFRPTRLWGESLMLRPGRPSPL